LHGIPFALQFPFDIEAWRSAMQQSKIVPAAIIALAFALAADGSRAQDSFPSRTVRIVVPYPAGGGTDTLARLLADQLSRKWGQSAIVENIGGGAGNIGAAEVARATPDGHTLLLASPGPIATNSFLYKEMGYDPARWVPIALLATGPYVLVMRKSFEGSTVKDLIAYAKANPGKMTSATPGVGSVGHLSTVQLEMLAGEIGGTLSPRWILPSTMESGRRPKPRRASTSTHKATTTSPTEATMPAVRAKSRARIPTTIAMGTRV